MKKCVKCKVIKPLCDYYKKETRCKPCCIVCNLKWIDKNKEKIKNKRKERQIKKRGNKPITESKSYKNTKYNEKYKEIVIKHYGGICACCGENNLYFLTIDHIKDNGKEHGTKNHRFKGERLYRLLKDLEYPDGIQILCFNCNIGKRNNKSVCPHFL